MPLDCHLLESELLLVKIKVKKDLFTKPLFDPQFEARTAVKINLFLKQYKNPIKTKNYRKTTQIVPGTIPEMWKGGYTGYKGDCV